MDLLSPPTETLSKDPRVYIWRASVIILVLCSICVQLWLGSNYVSKTDYERDKARSVIEREETNRTLTTINNTLIRIDEKMKGDETRDREITDHEKRIRDLERVMYGKNP